MNKVLKERRKREQNLLRSPLNWFSLVGLYPLRSGENTLGNTPSCTVSIPELPDGAEAVLSLFDNLVTLVHVSSLFMINTIPASPCQLRVDTTGNPDLLECGSLVMMVIQRGERFFLRVWDRNAQALRDFHGLNYYPVDPCWRVTAEFTPFDQPRETVIHNAVGGETSITLPGYASFQMNEVACTLLCEDDEDGLLFSFTDLTRQDTTYPGGRYLLTPAPVNGKLVLDFNLARNWPCAYTPYATCPLPPPENHLGIRVEAGEKRYHD